MADSSTKKRVKALLRESQQAEDIYRKRKLVQQALDLDPSSENANLWMAVYSEDVQQREYYIQRVLEINPRNRWVALLRKLPSVEERMAMQQSSSPLQQTPQKKSGNIIITMIMFTAFSLVALGVMLLFRTNQYRQETYLAESGVTAIATITDKTWRNDDDTTYYRLWYSFEAIYKNEQTQFDDVYSDVPKKVYNAIQIGEQHEILYLPEDPTVAQLASQGNAETVQSSFVRDLIVYSFFATIPVDIAVVMWVIKRSRKEKAEGEYNQEI